MNVSSNKDAYQQDLKDWPFRSGLTRDEELVIKTNLKEGRVLEAGTAGGRILLELKPSACSELYGFDFVEDYIKIARSRDSTGQVNFEVMDARQLRYPDNFFATILYMQQIICLIPGEHGRKTSLREAFRVMQEDGVAIFSFLSFEARQKSSFYKLFLGWIRVLRAVRGDKTSLQDLPWLKFPDGTVNWAAIFDGGPKNHWFFTDEVVELLQGVGFRIRKIGSSGDLTKGGLLEARSSTRPKLFEGFLYVVCSKDESVSSTAV
jgi:SAM-dependent methyltransferase